MMNNASISDTVLHSFVDNELEQDERSELLEVIGRDEALRERVCELRGLKEMVRHAYHHSSARGKSPSQNARPARSFDMANLQSIAACVALVLLGGLSGWFISAQSQLNGDQRMANLFTATTQSKELAANPDKIVVQVSNSDPVRLKTALDETESLLAAYKRSNRQLKMEIVANGSGLDLLRTGVSPYETRLALLKARYPNLDLVACNQSIGKLRKKGIIVQLLPQTGITPSAAEEIKKRLMQGWDYLRV